MTTKSVVSVELRNKISRYVLSGMKIGFARDFFREELEAENGGELPTQKRYYRIRTSLFTFCRERNAAKFAELQDKDAWKDAADVQYLSLVIHAHHFIRADEVVELGDMVDDKWLIDLKEIQEDLVLFEEMKYRCRSAESLLSAALLDALDQARRVKQLRLEILHGIENLNAAKQEMHAINETFVSATEEAAGLVTTMMGAKQSIDQLFSQLSELSESTEMSVQEIGVVDAMNDRFSRQSEELIMRLKQRISDGDMAVRTIESSISNSKQSRHGFKETGASESNSSGKQMLGKSSGAATGSRVQSLNGVAAIG